LVAILKPKNRFFAGSGRSMVTRKSTREFQN
jgi:hypothetical protein